MKKKRIAIWLQGGIGGGNFSQGYPPLLNFVSQVARNYEVTVYSILPANPDFVAHGFVFRTIQPGISSSRVRSILLFFLFLVDHCKKHFHLIHAFWAYPAGLLSVMLCKIINVPSIVTIQGGEGARIPSIRYGNMINPLVRRLTLWTCENATCLSSISEFLAAEIKRHGLKRNNIIVIPFGPDLNRFHKADKHPDETLRIIHVANLTEVKDQMTLLKAFKLINDQTSASLRIIGDGSLRQDLQSVVAALGLVKNVVFLGAIPQTELPLHYTWADIMMHTSLHEGQSGVVVEAMASGVVVCGTRVGIISDLEHKHCCAVVDVGDYKLLSSVVLRIWNDKTEFRQTQERAYNWVTGHSLSWTVNEFSLLYAKVIGQQYPL